MYPIIVSIPSMLGAFNQSDIFGYWLYQTQWLNSSRTHELLGVAVIMIGKQQCHRSANQLTVLGQLDSSHNFINGTIPSQLGKLLSKDIVESYSICVPPFHGAVPNLRVSFTASNKSVCLMTLALLDFHILAKLAVLLLIWVNNSNTNW